MFVLGDFVSVASAVLVVGIRRWVSVCQSSRSSQSLFWGRQTCKQMNKCVGGVVRALHEEHDFCIGLWLGRDCYQRHRGVAWNGLGTCLPQWVLLPGQLEDYKGAVRVLRSWVGLTLTLEVPLSSESEPQLPGMWDFIWRPPRQVLTGSDPD